MPEDERLFPIVQEAVQHKMKHQIEKAKVKKITVHDLRHSHVAYLINKGVEPLLIKERVGHKDIRITLNTYGHLYPNQQRKVADLLDREKSPSDRNHRDLVIDEDESSNINLRQVDYNRDSSGHQSNSGEKQKESMKGGEDYGKPED